MTLLASGASQGLVPVLFGFFIISVVVLIWAFSMKQHKALIAGEVHRLGARVLSIHWSPRFFLGDRNDTFYDVVMVLPSGRRVNAICKCNLFHGVYWQSMPWAQDLIQEPPPVPAVAHCKHCRQPLQSDWVACPKCGQRV